MTGLICGNGELQGQNPSSVDDGIFLGSLDIHLTERILTLGFKFSFDRNLANSVGHMAHAWVKIPPANDPLTKTVDQLRTRRYCRGQRATANVRRMQDWRPQETQAHEIRVYQTEPAWGQTVRPGGGGLAARGIEICSDESATKTILGENMVLTPSGARSNTAEKLCLRRREAG